MISSPASRPADAVALVVGSIEIHIPLSGTLDLDVEHARLEKKLAAIQEQIDRLEKLLSSDFASKAPPPNSRRSWADSSI